MSTIFENESGTGLYSFDDEIPVCIYPDLSIAISELLIIKTAPAGNRDGSRISEEIPYFCKDIVSSSEQLHNQNICVAVIFMLKITYFIKPR